MMPEPVAHHGPIFRIRELLIRPRIQAINGLRGHLTGSGLILPRGAANAARLIAVLEDPDNGLPPVPTLIDAMVPVFRIAPIRRSASAVAKLISLPTLPRR